MGRAHFVHGFLAHIAGIGWDLKTPMGIRADHYVVDVPTVTAAASRPKPVHADEAHHRRAHSKDKAKFTRSTVLMRAVLGL